MLQFLLDGKFYGNHLPWSYFLYKKPANLMSLEFALPSNSVTIGEKIITHKEYFISANLISFLSNKAKARNCKYVFSLVFL